MRFRHKKRGSEYELFDIIYIPATPPADPYHDGDQFRYEEDGEPQVASFQCTSEWYGDGLVVLYYPRKDVGQYARPALEFFDGRFERV